MRAEFRLEARDGQARVGAVETARGSFETPCFMPVGTRGAVRHLHAGDLESLGAEVLLANTYHLMLRPGVDVIAELGGIHRFTGWDGHMLTDSGGYQIFSLDADVDEDGAAFSSAYDGSPCRLTPEDAVALQVRIGADIAMVLDVCPSARASTAEHRLAVDRSAAWARRARAAFEAAGGPEAQCQFGIVQGGVHPALRSESAARTVGIGFDGYAVGGLSVGEERHDMLEALTAAVRVLPEDQPRYLMGLGDPVGIVEAVSRGVDMFDCVLPTRLARHGTVLSDAGRYNLTRSDNAASDEPIDPHFPDSPANRWSRGYLRHLMSVGEPTAARLLSLHNLAWLLRFMRQIRQAIRSGALTEMRERVHRVWD